MDIKEAYEELQKKAGIDEGDKVRILRSFKSFEMGCGEDFAIEMKSTIGKTGIVDRIAPDGIHVKTTLGGYWYPFFVLEVVEKASKVEISINRGNTGSIHCVSEPIAEKVEDIIKRGA